MKKIPKKVAAAATVFSAALNLTGCVYGPPIDPGEEMDIPYGYVAEDMQTVEEFDPAANTVPAVYGPPQA